MSQCRHLQPTTMISGQEAIKSGGDAESCIRVGASTVTKTIVEYIERAGIDMTKLGALVQMVQPQ